MFRILLAIFIIVPIIEIYLFMRIGEMIGVWPTLGMIILTAAIGVSMLKWQGLSTLQRAQSNLQENKIPATELVEGIILLLCGALLLTPGFFTDTVGFLMLVPPIRQGVAKALVEKGKIQMFNGSGFKSSGFSGFSTNGDFSQNHNNQDGDIIDGEFTKDDKPTNTDDIKKLD